MAALAAYRTRILNTLKSTNEKFDNDTIDEALQKVLDDYSRAFPNENQQSITIATAGRTQAIGACTGLITILQLVHPYDDSVLDPFVYQREDYYLTFVDGVPTLYFSGADIPAVDEKIYIRYLTRQTIDTLNGASATTVRDDHESKLVLGAAGVAAMARAAGTIEQWGGKPGDPNQLMLLGKQQYNIFVEFLIEIRTEQSIDIFPNAFWELDSYDSKDDF